MRFVPKAEARPHFCVVYPHLGASQTEGYVDTGNTVTILDGRPYVSVVAVREMCRLLGWPTPEQHAEVVAERDTLERDLALAREQLAEADEELGAIHILKGKGYKPAKRPGRPPKAAA